MTPIFITGISTDVGKTVAAAVLTEKLKADYWKPIQSGDLENSDTIKVKNLVSNTTSNFHPEAYRLTKPFSPHKSADLDGIEINLENINLPSTANQIIIEGAGGLMVRTGFSLENPSMIWQFQGQAPNRAQPWEIPTCPTARPEF